MQPTLDIRRHGDGSIDFDFYRRRAMRRRRAARGKFVRHCLAAAGRLIAGALRAGLGRSGSTMRPLSQAPDFSKVATF
jgi:hypothetical protein